MGEKEKRMHTVHHYYLFFGVLSKPDFICVFWDSFKYYSGYDCLCIRKYQWAGVISIYVVIRVVVGRWGRR